MTTKIQWTDETWNPIIGCSKVSAGCQNCYAEKMAFRLAMMHKPDYEKVADVDGDGYFTGDWQGETAFVESALEKPLHWKKPRMIFVCSMGDLFHPSVPFEWIDRVMAVVALCPQHTFMFLTKRSERMAEYFNSFPKEWCKRLEKHFLPITEGQADLIEQNGLFFPLRNLWLGVTCENQEMADKRIPVLLQIPAAKRFVSVEPMLGEVRLNRLSPNDNCFVDSLKGELCFFGGTKEIQKLDWVICGCESGYNARPMDIEWARTLRDRCKKIHAEAEWVPFFMKQMEIAGKVCKDINQFPVDLQVREFPEVEK